MTPRRRSPVPHAIARLSHTVRAARAHKSTAQDIDASYVNHLLEVAELVAHADGSPARSVVITALLHDTVEDVGVTEAQLVAEFGDARVAELVMYVTDDQTLSRTVARRHADREARRACRTTPS